MRARGAAVVGAFVLSACASGPAVVASPRSAIATSGPLTLQLGSSFVGGRFLPRATCDMRPDSSPALLYSDAGPAAQLALTMVDTTDGTVYWIITGLKPTSTFTTEHVLSDGAKEWPNDFQEATYDGPCQTHGETHTFAITLFALEGPVDLSSEPTAAASVALLGRVATAQVTVTAVYTRTGTRTPGFGNDPGKGPVQFVG